MSEKKEKGQVIEYPIQLVAQVSVEIQRGPYNDERRSEGPLMDHTTQMAAYLEPGDDFKIAAANLMQSALDVHCQEASACVQTQGQHVHIHIKYWWILNEDTHYDPEFSIKFGSCDCLEPAELIEGIRELGGYVVRLFQERFTSKEMAQ